MALKSEVESRRAEKMGFPIGTRAVGVGGGRLHWDIGQGRLYHTQKIKTSI